MRGKEEASSPPPLPGQPCDIEENLFGAELAAGFEPDARSFPEASTSDVSLSKKEEAEVKPPVASGEKGELEAFEIDPNFDYDAVTLSVRPWPWNPNGPGKPGEGSES